MHPLPASRHARPQGFAAPTSPIEKLGQSLSKTDTLLKITSLIAALIFVCLGL